MAPKMAISTAPPQTRIVPPRDHLVNGSPRIKVAHIELKTNPDYRCQQVLELVVLKVERTACSVERTGSGKVVICMELPATLLTMNMNMPI